MWFDKLATIPSALRDVVVRPNSLVSRIVLWQVAGSALLILGVCVTLYVGLVSQSAWVDDQTLEKRFMTVSALLASEAEREYWLAHEVSEDMAGPRRVLVRVVDDQGAVIAETPDMAEIAPAGVFPVLAPNGGEIYATIVGPENSHFRVCVERAPYASGGEMREALVQIAMDTTLDQVVLGRFQRLVVLVALFTLLLATVIGVYWVTRLLAPLTRIAHDIGEIDRSTLGRRVVTEGLPEELGHLAVQFNGLMDRLSSAIAGLRHYADNVAHELRTPLNKMVLGLEVALQRSRSAEYYEEVLSQVADECSQLNTLVDRLLFLARASSDQAAIMRQAVNIQAELEGVRQYFEASATEAGIRLALEPGGALMISADRTLLQRAVGNLVANAIAHTPSGGEVVLAARRDEVSAHIVVRDTGGGISTEDQVHIFDRFYRADKTRGAPAGRIGLGLPIAKSIVGLHGGGISVESEVGKGTTMTVSLPLVQAKA